ncbi:hypothetical protein J2X86_000352 [Acinetobacter lwoffii]|uniref:Uncharacterized protein n=1 Tax=Acinetobacter lwoffii TaxID=28090 RepID=A0AAW8LBN4_ACILW|nr:hypothetical protein [Acinetobacter lwoffii]MDR6628364.1 hypothetical protein [Acinetobacter lwoffii]
MDNYDEELIEEVENYLEYDKKLYLPEWNELKKNNPLLAEKIFKVYGLRDYEFEQIVEHRGINSIDIKHKIINYKP